MRTTPREPEERRVTPTLATTKETKTMIEIRRILCASALALALGGLTGAGCIDNSGNKTYPRADASSDVGEEDAPSDTAAPTDAPADTTAPSDTTTSDTPAPSDTGPADAGAADAAADRAADAGDAGADVRVDLGTAG
jgi:hypothetical protein